VPQVFFFGREKIESQSAKKVLCLSGNWSYDEGVSKCKQKSCCYCGKWGQHNRCLCPHRFSRPGTEALPVTTKSVLPQSTHSDGDSVGNLSPVTGDATAKEETVSSNVALLASGERVLLQTAIVPLQSLDRSVTVNTHVLLDSASQ